MTLFELCVSLAIVLVYLTVIAAMVYFRYVELNPITKNDVKEAFIDGYYYGAGDDAWYTDHDDEGNIKPNAGALFRYDQWVKDGGNG